MIRTKFESSDKWILQNKIVHFNFKRCSNIYRKTYTSSTGINDNGTFVTTSL